MMLKSLFGDLLPLRESRDAPAKPSVLDEARATDSRPPAPRRSAVDLWVTGSPTEALRAHFSASRNAPLPHTRTVTLDDPTGTWAPAVLGALADVSGRPVESLQLCDPDTRAVLARIERSKVARRADDLLKVYHVQVDPAEPDQFGIRMAMMERSDLAVVIAPALSPSAADLWLRQLRQAAAGPHWSCPCMLVLVPEGSTWMVPKFNAATWPAGLKVRAVAERLTSAGSVWNRLLNHWKQMRPGKASATVVMPVPPPPADPRAGSGTDTAVSSDWDLMSAFLDTHPPELSPEPGRRSVHTNNSMPSVAGYGLAAMASLAATPPLISLQAERTLNDLMTLDGLIYVALVEVQSGQIVASPSGGTDIDRAAVAAAELMRLHRSSLRLLSHVSSPETVDEVLVTAGSRYHVLCAVPGAPDLLLLAVLDKLRSNLASARHRILQAQQALR